MNPTTALSISDKPKLARGCRMGNDGMLLIPEGVLRLKGPAIEIVALCDGTHTYGGLLNSMRERYPAMIESDVEEFLQKLLKRGVMEC